MILSHRHRFIFFCNGRTGTTSVQRALEPHQEGAELDFGVPGVFVPKHVPPAMLKPCLPSDVWDAYFKFVFVRNPWDWFVSQWRYNFANAPQGGALGAVKDKIKGRKRRPDLDERHAATTFGAEEADLLFDYLRQFRALPGRSGLYQSNYVFDMDGRQLVDYVGRFESIEDDFAEVARHIGIDVTLPHLNRTERSHHRESFTREGRDRVSELWAVDIENFGYNFD